MECERCEGKGYVFESENKTDCTTCSGMGKVCNSCEGYLIDKELDKEICEDCLTYVNATADESKHPDEENK